MTDKAVLRERVNREISGLPEIYIAESDEGIFSAVVSLEEFKLARNIMMYYSVKREPSTIKIAEFALPAGKTVAFPFCYRGGKMTALTVTGLNELRPAMLGIPAPPESADTLAPEKIDLILVPALAYDLAGYRLGYGGGYYDRFLRGLPAFTAGLARERLMKDEVPREPHDIAVNFIVTEKNIRRLTT